MNMVIYIINIFFRDRYGYKYLEKNHLVPRGGQLVKYESQLDKKNKMKQQNKKKKRGYLQNDYY